MMKSSALLILRKREVITVLEVVEVLGVTLILMLFQALELLFMGVVVAEVFHVVRGIFFSSARVAFLLSRPLDHLHCRRRLCGSSPGFSPFLPGVPPTFFPVVSSPLSLGVSTM